MLLLVLADRHMRRAIEQDVGGHQAGIGVEADGGVLAILAGLLLELRHAVEPAHAGDAIEHPGEFGVLGDLALVEDDMLLRIDAGRNEGRRHLANAGLEVGRVLRHGDGVQIDDAIDAVVCALQLDEFDDRAEIVAKMQVSRRLHAGENPLNELRHDAVPRIDASFEAALRYRKESHARQEAAFFNRPPALAKTARGAASISKSPYVAAPCATVVEKGADRRGDLMRMGFKREMTGLEEAHLGVGIVAPERLRAGRQEERIVLAPDRQESAGDAARK